MKVIIIFSIMTVESAEWTFAELLPTLSNVCDIFTSKNGKTRCDLKWMQIFFLEKKKKKKSGMMI